MRGGARRVRSLTLRPGHMTDPDSGCEYDHCRRSDDGRHPPGVALRSLTRVRWRRWGRPAVGARICRWTTLPGARRGAELRVAGQCAECVGAVGKAGGRDRGRTGGRGRSRAEWCVARRRGLWKCTTNGRERDTPSRHSGHGERGRVLHLRGSVRGGRLLSSFVRHRVSSGRSLPVEGFPM